MTRVFFQRLSRHGLRSYGVQTFSFIRCQMELIGNYYIGRVGGYR